MLKDKLQFLLLKYGELYRSHSYELFFYSNGTWDNVKHPDAEKVSMDKIMSEAEGLFYLLGEVVSEEDACNWATVEEALKQQMNQYTHKGIP